MYALLILFFSCSIAPNNSLAAFLRWLLLYATIAAEHKSAHAVSLCPARIWCMARFSKLSLRNEEKCVAISACTAFRCDSNIKLLLASIKIRWDFQTRIQRVGECDHFPSRVLHRTFEQRQITDNTQLEEIAQSDHVQSTERGVVFVHCF